MPMYDEAGYLAAYDAVLARWPVPVEPVDLTSDYGTTRVNVCGLPDGRPLVLLHGSGATSAVWFNNVGELSRTNRVYAVDIVGNGGRSTNDGRPVDSLERYLDWLDGVFDGLALDAAALCGHSYGSWLAANYARHAPDRVRRLALLDPTDVFTGLSLSYRLHAVPLIVRPSPDRMRSFLAWETRGMPVDPAWLELACLGVEYPHTRIVLPRPLKEPLTVPTLVLLAERSRAHDVRRLSAAAHRLMPAVETVTLPGVSHHTVPTEHAVHLNRELGAFLGRGDG